MPALRTKDLSRLGLRLSIQRGAGGLLRGMDTAPPGQRREFRFDRRQVG